MTVGTIDLPARLLRRSQRLMDATRGVHESLDTRIIGAEPFRDREHYARLLEMQYHFHRDVDALYTMALPLPSALNLPTRRRFAWVRQDMLDLGHALPVCEHPAVFGDAPIAPATGIGWLWVVEGSNLGAASLLKRAAALGLGPSFGARHLAGHLDSRGAYWKAFTTAIDALVLDDVGERQMMDGAQDAFAHVRVLADASFA